MKWLHISDIHFNFKGFENSNARNKLIKKLQELKVKVDFILITGDCLFKYGSDIIASNDTDDIIKYIKLIAKSCNCSYKRVYICQGNHDVDRDNKKRNSTINNVLNGNIDFNSYYDNLNNWGNEKFQLIVKGVTSYKYNSYKIFEPQNTNYRVISLNSCLLSKDKTDFGKLRICSNKLTDLERNIYDDERINILIMHHGIDFLNKRDAITFEHWIEDHHIDVVFCGHTHRSALETYDETYRDIKQFTAGALVVDDYAIPSFYLCEYVLGYDLFVHLYTYSKDSETWSLDNHSLRKFKNGTFDYTISRIFEKMKTSNKFDVSQYT